MPTGRPTAYKEEYAELAYKFCLLGADDKKLAEFFEVKEQTINNWKKAHPEFFESIKRGKVIADAEVADSLYKRATGYTHKETKVFNNQGEIVTHDVDKHYAPDPTAIAYWLNNRQRGQWAQRQDVSLGNKDGESFKTENKWEVEFINADKTE